MPARHAALAIARCTQVMQLTWTGQTQHVASVASQPPPLLAGALADSLLLVRADPISGRDEVRRRQAAEAQAGHQGYETAGTCLWAADNSSSTSPAMRCTRCCRMPAGFEPRRGPAAAAGAGLDQPGQLRPAAQGSQHSTHRAEGGEPGGWRWGIAPFNASVDARLPRHACMLSVLTRAPTTAANGRTRAVHTTHALLGAAREGMHHARHVQACSRLAATHAAAPQCCVSAGAAGGL